jgi:mono/diheme cytochrome c family protein
MQKKLILIFQIVTLLASSTILFILLIMITRGTQPEWKLYQQMYLLKAIAFTDSGQQHAKNSVPRIHQLDLQDINRIDRCMTCHAGIENASMSNQPIPFRTHTGKLLKQHPPERFGCTICHGGQGQAIDRRNAHATEKGIHWNRPLLEGRYLQSSCGQCHLSIYSHGAALNGTNVLRKGQQIFSQEGCLGCHKARGFGGSKGPDLSEQGGKTRHEYNYRHVRGEKTISNWLYSHFKEPEKISPGSQMPAINLAKKELEALVTFTMSLNKPDIPLDYFSLETLKELKGRRAVLSGKDIFSMNCSACHGKSGEGKNYADYNWGVPSISNQDFLSVASPDYIEMTLWHGRAGRQMASWTPRFSGIKLEEIMSVADFIKSRRIIRSSFEDMKEKTGDSEHGNILFNRDCSFCHGQQGGEMQIITLSNQDFLAVASNEFIYKTIIHGRRNTAMPGWSQLSSQDVADIISFLRQWQKYQPKRLANINQQGDISSGEKLYHYRCSRCHGSNGEGNSAPAIANKDFLFAASDAYIHASIANGRRHTAMFGWHDGLRDSEKLSTKHIADITAYLRFRSKNPTNIIFPGPNLGRAENGVSLFSQHCSECHGNNGDGKKAPALNNQEFLNSVTNGYILATMSLGRSGTKMPSWGRGSEIHSQLTVEERFDITAAVRRWQGLVIRRPDLSVLNEEIIMQK